MSQKYEHFGKYILLEKLAMGGMAEVFLARTVGASGISKFVAVKRILPQFSDNPEFRKMFQEEAKIAINLSHSNIVSIYEFGIDAGQLYIAMDYVEGRNLRQILNKMKGTKSYFTLEQDIYIVKEVAAGLDHAHRSLSGATGKPLNITHRDISPQNVMVSFEGEIKIVDFGIAKAESQMEHTKTGTLKGKFGYMSPEQAEGHSTDLRTDIFSLGIVLWELIAKDRLFTANNEINTLRKIRDCQIPSLRKIDPNIDPELERIVMKALARDRNLRYQTAAALHRDLNRFLNRQYPDFSPHDFSVFTKTIYSDEILETRKRLVKYANIPYQGDDENEKTMVTPLDDTADQPAEGPQNFVLDPNATSITSVSHYGNTLDDTGVANSIVTTDTNADLVGASPSTTVRILSEEALKTIEGAHLAHENTFTAIRLPQVDPKSRTDEIQLENTGSRKRGPKVRIIKKKKSFATSFASMILLIASIVGTFTLIMRAFPSETDGIRKQVKSYAPWFVGFLGPDPIIDPNPGDGEGIDKNNGTESGETTQASKSKLPPLQKIVGLQINSSPSGASIYINGEDMNRVTPTRVNVPGDKPFQITLKKDRYLTYNRDEISAVKAYPEYHATLQKAMIGYLDIDVKPPRNARVYINGEYLKGEMLPISKYSVSARTPIVIEAENPVTGYRAIKEVTLQQEQRLRVVLKLEKSKK